MSFLPLVLSGLITAVSLLIVDLVVPGIKLDTVTASVIAAASIGIVNAFIKPILTVVSFPVNLVTFGLFSFVVNGLCLWISSWFVPGFHVHGILGFLLGPVVLSFVTTFISKYLVDRYPQLMGSTEVSAIEGGSNVTTTDS